MTFLETNRLRLRNVSPKDAIQMVDYRNNERCSKYQRGQTKDYKDIVTLIERNKDNALNVASPTMISVALRETDVMIGEIVVMPNEGTISLGYTFSYKVHRNGYAYEALSSLIEYLHKHYPQWDFICFTERENIPSMSLLKKLGYTNLPDRRQARAGLQAPSRMHPRTAAPCRRGYASARRRPWRWPCRSPPDSRPAPRQRSRAAP